MEAPRYPLDRTGNTSTALEQSGLEVFLLPGTLDRAVTGVYSSIDAGRPPLVMLSADGTAHHYELVLGYDEPRGNLIVLDPMRGEILVPLAIFERNWERCQRFMLLACRKDIARASRRQHGACDAMPSLADVDFEAAVPPITMQIDHSLRRN